MAALHWFSPACQLPPKFLDWLQSDGPFSSIRMPPVLLSCGDADPVVLSSHCIAKAMAQRGMTAELILYPGTHAFFGVPSAWTFGSCHSNAMHSHSIFCSSCPAANVAVIMEQLLNVRG